MLDLKILKLNPQQKKTFEAAEKYLKGSDARKANYRSWHEDEVMQAEGYAIKDGQSHIPSGEHEGITPQELAIKADYESKKREFIGEGNPAQICQNLEENFNQYKDRWDNPRKVTAERRDMIQKDFKNKIADCRQEFELTKRNLDERLEAKRNEYERVRDKFEEVQKKHNRHHTDGTGLFIKKPWLELLIIGLFGLLEIPINYKVFSIFGESVTNTYLISFALVIFLIGITYFCGVFYKRRKDDTTYMAYGKLCLLLILTFCFTAALLRYNFIIYESKLFSIALAGGEHVDFTTFLKENFKIIDAFGDFQFYLFLSLNLMVFAIGIFIAYMSKDSRKEYETVYMEHYHKEQAHLKYKKETEKTIEKKTDEYEKEREELNDKKRGSINNVELEIQDGKAIYSHYSALYDQVFAHVTGFAAMAQQDFKSCVSRYITTNIAERKSANYPTHWNKETTIQLEIDMSQFRELNTYSESSSNEDAGHKDIVDP